MFDAPNPCRPESNAGVGATLWRPRNAAIVISNEALRLAEKRALSRRDWRTTNGGK
jgi:hypothetical protein